MHIRFIVLLLLLVSMLQAEIMTKTECYTLAENKLKQLGFNGSISSVNDISDNSRTIARVFELFPQGYIITTCNELLPPVIAYSLTNPIAADNEEFQDMIKADLDARYNNINDISNEVIEQNVLEWQELLQDMNQNYRPEQWPPEGSTPTGGWLLENWAQGSPWNQFCPLDDITNARSLAGCPSIAMGQIINYHRTTNEVSFDDDDDYYHNYAGRQYWVDDNWQDYDFLSFPQINTYLDSLQNHYIYDVPVSAEEKAALIFACGVAAQQVYTSGGSGTFGLGQAFEAFQKFNFDEAIHLNGSEPDFWEHIIDNIMNALPVHFATISPAGDSGHNFVVDGYNTDGFYHCNYGWGGGSNGWYLLPDEVPYNLTVIEGAIVDIIPQELASGFIQGSITLLPASLESTIFLDISKTGYTQSLELDPQENGSTPYICQVPVGSYTVCASYSGYEEIFCSYIVVNEFETTQVDIELSELKVPHSLSVEQDNNVINLSWQHDGNRELIGFNIYRNIEGTAFMCFDYTEDTTYEDNISQSIELTYGYYVTAVYAQNNESTPSDTAFIEYNVSSDDECPSPVTNLRNYPNPFNPQTTISFSLSEKEAVKLEIFNIRGKSILVLVDKELPYGDYNYIWKGRDYNKNLVSSGIYYYRLSSSSVYLSGKCILLK